MHFFGNTLIEKKRLSQENIHTLFLGFSSEALLIELKNKLSSDKSWAGIFANRLLLRNTVGEAFLKNIKFQYIFFNCSVIF